jgi:23S rRNA pseudouridine1911/1915/1917 synthase
MNNVKNNKQSCSLVVDESGIRLDKYVSERFSELSRNQIQKLISDGYVKVNGRNAKPGLKLDTGDVIDIDLPPASLNSVIPEDIPINILYEDNDLLVVDKPAGMTVHPAAGHHENTLVNALLYHTSSLADTGDRQRPGIVHRLDKDTSGVMLVAKNRSAYLNLTSQFKNRAVIKKYFVLVKGHLTPQEGVIEASIGRNRINRERMAVVSEGRGKEARTEYNVVDYISDYTLLEVHPETGRTHQIRVHLAAIGYPVAGDKIYGVKTSFLTRQFVHSSCIGFCLPSTDEYVEFTSPLPPDLKKALKEIS